MERTFRERAEGSPGAALLERAQGARVVLVALDGGHRAATLRALFSSPAGLEVRVRIGPVVDVGSGTLDVAMASARQTGWSCTGITLA